MQKGDISKSQQMSAKRIFCDRPDIIVSTAWLAKHLEGVKILDGSWYLPGAQYDGQHEYERAHILGAQFFDIDTVCDPNNHLPHMVPDDTLFTKHMENFGLSNDDQIVIYDKIGLFSAPRVRWHLRLMGFKKVAVLDGGFPKWLAENLPITTQPTTLNAGKFIAQRDKSRIAGREDVKAAISSGKHIIFDARPKNRFSGDFDEPRAGLRSGHIPTSYSMPFMNFINRDGTLRLPHEIKKIFEKSGLDAQKSVIVSCGSGITAAIIGLGLELIGRDDYALYDGSWSEWGADPNLPIEKGGI